MAKLGCCGSTFRCLFIFFNVIFCLIGLATVGFGIYLKVSPQASRLLDLVELNTNNAYLAAGAWVIIGFGAVVFIVSFLGCVGAAISNRVLLGLYILLAVIIICGELAAFVVTILFVVRSDDVTAFQRDITQTFQKEYKPGRTKFTQPWDTVQAWFQCCGVNNHTDYVPIYENSTVPLPLTCCRLAGDQNPDDPLPVDELKCFNQARSTDTSIEYTHLHSRGCFELLKDTVKEYSTVLLIIQAVVIVITIIGVVIAACLCRRHGEKNI